MTSRTRATTRFVATALAVLLAAGGAQGQALPKTPTVVSGQASFQRAGNVYSITNTPGAILQWQGFSIGAGQTTRFIQQNAASTVLNRVTGADPSLILGTLRSNGRVVLVNPNGVLFGAGARVDVNGLVASSLGLSNADFRAGRMNFSGAAGAGAVANEGRITTPEGGKVYLVAPSVENSGVIHAPGGEVVLAAGRSVQLADSRHPDLQVVVSAPGDRALNLGTVLAEGGRIGIYGALVKQRGKVNADSAVVGADGRIVLRAGGDLQLEAGSVTSARGAGTGGTVHLLGERVGLFGDARVDASGQSGGGTVLVGGDAHGANPAIPNARQVVLASASTIRADAIASGNGGKVVAWSDQATRVAGHISARGGSRSGDGGWVEISGRVLDMQGQVDTRAPKGRTGSLLLDPTNIFIAADQGTATNAGMQGSDTAIDSDSGFVSGNAVRDSLLTVQALESLLAGSMVTVTTANPAGTGAGNITVVSPVSWNSDTSLTLRADAAVHVNAPIGIDGFGGVLNVIAGTAINVNAPINSTRDDGVMNLTAGSGIHLNARISSRNYGLLAMRTAGGDITQTEAGAMSVHLVSARADTGAVRLGQANSIGELSGVAGGAGGFQFRNAGLLQVKAVGAEDGVTVTGSGSIVLDSDGGILVRSDLRAGTGNVTLASSAGTVEVLAPATVRSNGGRITIQGVVVQATLADCTANPVQAGCAGVLPTLAQCVAAPVRAGCAVVLPSVAKCVSAPTTAGCSAVLPSLAQCTANASLPGCSAVLPTVAQCVADRALQGCGSVLPTLASCVSSPTLVGCSAVLPTLAQCQASPTLQGCSVVLPPVSACSANPTAPGCAAASAPVASAIVDARAAVIVAMGQGAAPAASSGPPAADADKDKDGVFLPEGVKPQAATRMFCN